MKGMWLSNFVFCICLRLCALCKSGHTTPADGQYQNTIRWRRCCAKWNMTFRWIYWLSCGVVRPVCLILCFVIWKVFLEKMSKSLFKSCPSIGCAYIATFKCALFGHSCPYWYTILYIIPCLLTQEYVSIKIYSLNFSSKNSIGQ